MNERLIPMTGPLVVPEGGTTLLLSLVVPTYNEADNVLPLLEKLTATLDESYAGRYEIIFVDDNSPDGTAQQVEAAASKYPAVKLMVRTDERGLATAVVRGWQAASGQLLGVIDADLQHPPAVLTALLEAMERGCDLSLASRYMPDGSVGTWGPLRRLVSRMAGFISWVILPEIVGRVSDPMSGFFICRRQVVANRVLQPTGYKILLEVLVRGGAEKIEEVPFTFHLRLHGQTKISTKLYCQYLIQLFQLRQYLWQSKQNFTSEK